MILPSSNIENNKKDQKSLFVWHVYAQRTIRISNRVEKARAYDDSVCLFKIIV